MTSVERVLVLGGGLSPEREVSLRSAHRVVDALHHQGIEAAAVDVDAGLLDRLADERPDAVFLALHGIGGEDGAVAAVLELTGTPYVGSPPAASRIAFDKPASKVLLARAGISTPDSVVLPHAVVRDLGAAAVLPRVLEHLPPPVVVKPARGGSALGMSVVSAAAELPAALVSCYAYDDEALIERFVRGAEIAVAVIDCGAGPEALPAVEIDTIGGVFDYAARYSAGATRYFAPARLSAEVATEVAALAVRAHAALGLRAFSRLDLIVGDGTVHALEAVVCPGMTDTSLFPMAVQAAGREFGSVCLDLVRAAVDSHAG